MPRPFKPKVVTANDLFEGDVVYLRADETWSRAITDAAVARTPEEADALLAKGAAQPGKIVGAYLADVALAGDTPTPDHFRETFRTRGPSNRHHGKQAEA